MQRYLAEQDAFSPKKRGTFTVCTSGDPQVYLNVAKRLGLFEPDDAKVVEI